MGLTQVSTAGVKDDAVTAGKIPANAVGTSEIAADAVTGAQIADDAINSEHYTDGSIDTAHIADLNVTTGKIAADAITGAKIADDAIDSEHYTDGSIDTAHIADDAVTADKLANAINTDIAAKAVLTGSTNNTVATVTGANALTGEANLTFSGSNLKVTNSSGAAEVTVVTPDNTDGGIYFNDGANAGAVTYLHTDNSMSFRVNTADTFKLDSSGNARIADGDLIIGTSGHGIDFSATGGPTNGSDYSELLDDYEEGNWWPAWANGIHSGATYYYNQGKYVKIGRHVTFNFYIYINVASTNNAVIQIGGLPYASSNQSGEWTPGSGSVTYHTMVLNTAIGAAGIYFNKNTTYFSLYDGGTKFWGANNQSQNGTYLIGGGTYMTD